ncbi:Mitochondrial fission process protein 1, partial [Penaeus vannamei]
QPGATQRAITHAAVDTLLWQAFASVIVPGFTINRVCVLPPLYHGQDYSENPSDNKKMDNNSYWPRMHSVYCSSN